MQDIIINSSKDAVKTAHPPILTMTDAQFAAWLRDGEEAIRFDSRSEFQKLVAALCEGYECVDCHAPRTGKQVRCSYHLNIANLALCTGEPEQRGVRL